MTLRFGTDGVRGLANGELTPELILALGRAAARTLGAKEFVIGRDTRRSGALVEAALVAGLCAEGASVRSLGVVPTPAVARTATDGRAGAMISASHNPFPDNGVKFFGPGGRKLSDRDEEALESALDRILSEGAGDDVPVGDDVGVATPWPEAVDEYVDALVGALDGRRLDRLAVVLDCAHGSATTVAPAAFTAAGADVTVIGADPDGRNINDGVGSTAPDSLAAAVVESRADLGLAFDGDADRLVAVAGDGSLVDGDRLMCLFAVDLDRRGLLHHSTLVVTVMSNLGLRLAMERAGIGVVETAVGDRYVLDALDEGGFALGGEQSGHLIFRDLAATGDGVLSGLLLADLVVRAGQPLAALSDAAMTRLPQVLLNVPVTRRPPDVASELAREVAAAERSLGGEGRVLLRPSGTEPLIRVMVEAADHELATAVAESLEAEVKRRYGRHPSRSE